MKLKHKKIDISQNTNQITNKILILMINQGISLNLTQLKSLMKLLSPKKNKDSQNIKQSLILKNNRHIKKRIKREVLNNIEVEEVNHTESLVIMNKKKKKDILRNLMSLRNHLNPDLDTNKINYKNPEVGAIVSFMKKIITRTYPKRLRMSQLLRLMIFTPKAQKEEEEAEVHQLIMIELQMKAVRIEVGVIEIMITKKDLISVIIKKMKKTNRIRKKLLTKIKNNH